MPSDAGTGDAGDTETRVAAFVVEYKAPHKLKLEYVYHGLEGNDVMDLDKIICRPHVENTQDTYRRLIAANMVTSPPVKLSSFFGYQKKTHASSNITFLFRKTRWAAKLDGVLTAQRTTDLILPPWPSTRFTLQALPTVPRSHDWRNTWMDQLSTWEVVYEELVEELQKTRANAAILALYMPKSYPFHSQIAHYHSVPNS
ncbi:hypothetical protein EJ06DRAFT_547218 [Trichodelitschia bisporula]|uniref:Uncharacterized protein n=1 Tax=Trichodelitschia bisporula TaxID=703511 RepID=A0A6G1I3S7_9PEZI|nr:hypothetical protein EJ06DRAFT_547218 [Trichodelitschia bisporula]